jgi:methylamine dehydrogenase heavy chain
MKPDWPRTVLFLLVLGATPAMAAEFKPEVVATTMLPPALHRVYRTDVAFPHMADGRISVLDGTDLALKGMMEAGFAGVMVAAPDKHRFYVATTFYERLTRGKRTDVIQVFDDQSLKVIEEIPISIRPRAGAELSQPVPTFERWQFVAGAERRAGYIGHRS